jgi:hypothetical protein
VCVVMLHKYVAQAVHFSSLSGITAISSGGPRDFIACHQHRPECRADLPLAVYTRKDNVCLPSALVSPRAMSLWRYKLSGPRPAARS